VTIAIAPLVERDFFAWYTLFAEYAASTGVQPTDENVMRVWAALQSDQAYGAIAKDASGATVGLAHAMVFERLTSGETGYVVEDVFVSPSSRQQGVATSLVEHLRSHAEAERRSTLRWVTRSGDAAAAALQQRFATAAGDWVLSEMPVG
jgi:GNAT superfamily N-acetyltransferase